MDAERSSRSFTEPAADAAPLGPPLIGVLLRKQWETVRQRMLARLHERGFGDLDAPHLNVLQYPGPQGMRPTDLAERLRVSKQALSYQLRELEQLGYLERRADANDRRSRRIHLTPRGTSALWAIRGAVHDIERDWAEQLGAERFAQLRTLLLDLDELSGALGLETEIPS
jgi:DNA-binding MarR family transcriptional regulator